jgi:hypothetical protein
LRAGNIIIMMFLILLDLRAQVVPGYQGKKNIFSYQLSSSPAFAHPTFLNRTRSNYNYPQAKRSFFVPFNFTHGISYERVTGRKFSLEFDYLFAATKDYINFTQTVKDDHTNSDQVIEFADVKMNMYGHYFSGSFVFYSKNSLAPLGAYFKLNFGYCLAYAQFPGGSYSSEPTSALAQSTIYTFQTKGIYYGQSSGHAGFSFGSNRIYKHKWVVSKGFTFSYLFKPNYKYTEEENVYDKLYRRLRAHDLANIYIKVGYLL